LGLQKMDTKLETKKRLEISKEITNSILDCTQGIMLGGSMGFGQNYSVTDKSDVDMVIVIEKDQLEGLLKKELFKDKIPEDIISAFKEGGINLFWATNYIKGIEINSFVYEINGYEQFLRLQGNLKGYKKTKPKETQESFNFKGEKISFHKKVNPYKEGFIFEKPTLANGRYYGRVPRQDYLYSGTILFERDSLFSSLEPLVWKSAIKQLVKEHGPNPDLEKTNILNTHFSYQTARHKLPEEVIQKIRERTKEELEKATKHF